MRTIKNLICEISFLILLVCFYTSTDVFVVMNGGREYLFKLMQFSSRENAQSINKFFIVAFVIIAIVVALEIITFILERAKNKKNKE